MPKLKRSDYFAKVLLPVLLIFTFSLTIHATQYRLFRTKKAGNVVTLTADAKVVSVQRSPDVKSYSLWRNGRAYITINRVKYTNTNGLLGVIPPGRYVLRVLGSPISLMTSVTINLDTVYKPFKVILWGKQNKLVKPLWDGNVVVITKATNIINFFYDGTHSMGIFPFGVHRAILRYISPHNIFNPGPKVIGGRGGRTLIGQTLPVGIYTLTPGRGKADGIVKGHIVIQIR